MSGLSPFPKSRRQTDAAGKQQKSSVSPSVALPSVALSEVALSEVFAQTVSDAAMLGFVLSQIPQGPAPVLWIQDRMSRRETGRPCLAGLGAGRTLLLMTVPRPADVLIAAEEGLRCKSLAAVVAEVWGDPVALSFTATKRLALRAEAVGVPCWLIRHGGAADLSAARDRWRIISLPSAPNADDIHAPGDPRWRLDLFRSRDKKPGLWVAQHDRAADRVNLFAAIPDGAVAEDTRTGGQRAAR